MHFVTFLLINNWCEVSVIIYLLIRLPPAMKFLRCADRAFFARHLRWPNIEGTNWQIWTKMVRFELALPEFAPFLIVTNRNWTVFPLLIYFCRYSSQWNFSHLKKFLTRWKFRTNFQYFRLYSPQRWILGLDLFRRITNGIRIYFSISYRSQKVLGSHVVESLGSNGTGI